MEYVERLPVTPPLTLFTFGLHPNKIRPHSTQLETTKGDDTVINMAYKELQKTVFILY